MLCKVYDSMYNKFGRGMSDIQASFAGLFPCRNNWILRRYGSE